MKSLFRQPLSATLTLQRREFHAFAKGLYQTHNVNIVSGEGSYLTDANGKTILDAHSMYGVTLFGHSAGVNFAPVFKQMQDGKLPMTHGAFPKGDAEYSAKLIAGKTAACLGGKPEDFQVYFNNTGAEAVDTAVKFARQWGAKVKGLTDGNKIVYAMSGCFHGRAFGGTSLFDDDKPVRKVGFGPLLPGIKHLMWNDVAGLEALREDGKNVAAVILEPIQGEGGIIVPSDEFIRKLAEICKEQKILIIADEVQSGIHRTGPFWASAHYNKLGFKPDIITSAKALGGGVYPVGAVIMTNEVADIIKPGMHGSTFGGNAIGMAFARRTLDLLEEYKIEENVTSQGVLLGELLATLKANNPGIVTGLTGKGLWRGIEFDPRFSTHEIESTMIENGILTGGSGKNVLRIAPALNVTAETLEQAAHFLDKGFKAIARNPDKHLETVAPVAGKHSQNIANREGAISRY